MKNQALFLVALAASSFSYAASDTRAAPLLPSASLVSAQIDDAVWSFKHSSMSNVLDNSTKAASLELLERARGELAIGHVKTAQELTRRASRPLADMSDTAIAGKHPDLGAKVGQLAATLESMIARAEQLAVEKSASGAFVSVARGALSEARKLAAANRAENAVELIRKASDSLNREVARLRSGDSYVLGVPAGQSEKEWSDGMRRFNERMELTRYLIIEAQAEGIDTAPLFAAMETADNAFDDATRSALSQQWSNAFKALDIAYLSLEDSWRQVGVEW